MTGSTSVFAHSSLQISLSYEIKFGLFVLLNIEGKKTYKYLNASGVKCSMFYWFHIFPYMVTSLAIPVVERDNP